MNSVTQEELDKIRSDVAEWGRSWAPIVSTYIGSLLSEVDRLRAEVKAQRECIEAVLAIRCKYEFGSYSGEVATNVVQDLDVPLRAIFPDFGTRCTALAKAEVPD